jgi:hypothetical protein
MIQIEFQFHIGDFHAVIFAYFATNAGPLITNWDASNSSASELMGRSSVKNTRAVPIGLLSLPLFASLVLQNVPLNSPHQPRPPSDAASGLMKREAQNELESFLARPCHFLGAKPAIGRFP